MTTIATDGKTMAGDGQMIGDYICMVDACKMWCIPKYEPQVPEETLIGCAGPVDEAEVFQNWYKAGCPDEKKPKVGDKFEALVARGGRVYSYADNLSPLHIGEPAATGSGAVSAMGAMLAGASPKEAVEIAIKLDPHTGGRITVIGVRD